MQYLFSQWPKLKAKLRAKFVYLFLDYDGTLTKIVKRPEDARLSGPAKQALKKLVAVPHFKVAIVSGRSLDNIRKLVNLKGAIYVGNHGLEIEGPQIKFKAAISPDFIQRLKQMKAKLKERLAKFKGAWVEDKGLSLSLHYRLAEKRNLAELKAIFKEVVFADRAADELRIRPGKKVLEIRPAVEWDKGKALLWLLAKQQFTHGRNDALAIYLGDDLTDEDAFRVLKNKGLAVLVGRPKKSKAQYYLKNPQEVIEFLKAILRCQN